MPLHTRRKVNEAVLNEILGLHNNPKAVVHSVHKLMGPKKKKIWHIWEKGEVYIGGNVTK